MTGNWWIDVNGRNTLKGVHGDDSNPIILTDDMIMELVITYSDARRAFFEIVPTMLPEEQERLYGLKTKNPYAFVSPQVDHVTANDQLMRSWNTRSIRNVGPRGGGL